MTYTWRNNYLDNELHEENLGLLGILTAPRGLPGFWMVSRDAQADFLPYFESSIWLREEAVIKDKRGISGWRFINKTNTAKGFTKQTDMEI